MTTYAALSEFKQELENNKSQQRQFTWMCTSNKVSIFRTEEHNRR